MPRKINLRLSQTIVPFGVGAICVINGESFVGKDTNQWGGLGVRLDCKRLSDTVGVDYFKSAPSTSGGLNESVPGIPYYRFPRWLFCMSCRGMMHWRTADENPDDPPYCKTCRGRKRLIPMRFILVCEHGHMSDVPWDYWAHSSPQNNHSQKQCQRRILRFLTIPSSGGGLGSLKVSCSTCKAERSLEGLATVNSMQRLGIKCNACQPWDNRATASEICSAVPQVVQSGASNVYFSKVASALDIPPDSNFINHASMANSIKNHRFFSIVKEMDETSYNNRITRNMLSAIADELGCTESQIESVIKYDSADLNEYRDENDSHTTTQILEGEWAAFMNPQIDSDERDKFLTRHVEISNDLAIDSLSKKLDKVVQATKLREVRALEGFSRYIQTVEPASFIRPFRTRQLPWLPAIEIFGEGIFVSFKEATIRKWETQIAVKNKVAKLTSSLNRSHRSSWLAQPTPRFIMLHTLAHILIRQLSYECGYSSSALRERIYCSTDHSPNPMGGILIYTASGDSEGTLGGLVRQANVANLERLIVNALEKSSWCSNDPVCQESEGQGVDALNLAACHACALVPETSCIYGNCMLDRSLVIGSLAHRTGFLEDVSTEAISRL